MRLNAQRQGRARHAARSPWRVRAAVRIASEAACRGLPALPFCVYTMPAASLRCSHGLGRPEKAASHNSTMGGRQRWFFITINCMPRGKNQLCRADTGDAVLTAVKFNHERFVWHCRLCLLMPDHLHAIVAFPRVPGMETTIKNRKKFVAGEHGVDWQRDFFDHRLRDHHELEEKTSYILMNPVRRGLCKQVEDWVWVYHPNDRPPLSW